jgi:hypothetical protein
LVWSGALFRAQDRGAGSLPGVPAGDAVDAVNETATESREKRREKRGVFCAACGLHVADPDDRMAVDGSVTHACANPAGIIFRFDTFRTADGCLVHGEPTKDFSWFAGFAWSYAICGRCFVHLGWRFTPLGPGSDAMPFFALIADAVNG